jgi:hypothetical protein
MGEVICMVGETERLGRWKDLMKGVMTWTEGHWWTLSFDADVTEPFCYKFVVVDHDSKTAKRWEQGPNRICDPEFLADEDGLIPRKKVLEQEWDHFTVTFSIYLPTGDP